MTTLNAIVDEVLLDLESYGVVQPQMTTLSAALLAVGNQVQVASAAGIPVGLVEIDNELMYVQSTDTDANTLTVIRGYRTTAATHAVDSLVTVAPSFPRQQVVNAVNDAITSSYPQLFKVSTVDLTAAASDDTYALTGVGRVLRVSNQDVGPSTEYVPVKSYRYDADLGKLTIGTGMVPGTPIRVVCTSAPVTLTATQELTASGLQESAKSYVVLAAAAKLIMHMDGSRLAVNSASADDMEANRTVGSATQVAKTLLAAAEMELAKEQSRLRQKYPATITFTRGSR